MSFEEWFKQNPLSELVSSATVGNMEDAWNAAIDEAVKRINKAGFFDGDVSSDYVAKAVEKLKDGI